MLLGSQSDTFPRVERILVLENPFSTHSERGKQQLQDLKSICDLPSDTVETDFDSAVTSDRLFNKLELTDLLFIWGGDGTVKSVIEPAVRTQALVLATRSGNANDFAMSMNGRKEPWQVFSEYLQGRASVVKIRPIEVTIDDGNTSETDYAINYASFGYAALASQYINQPWKHPFFKHAFDILPASLRNVVCLPREGALLSKAATKAVLFKYSQQNTNSEEEKLKEAVDISVVHSSRMAKFGRFNIRHTDPFIFTSVLTEPGIEAMGRQFIKMKRGKMTGEYVTNLACRVINTSDDSLYYQVDGEASLMPDDSNINVSIANSSLRVLSTRLSDHPITTNR